MTISEKFLLLLNVIGLVSGVAGITASANNYRKTELVFRCVFGLSFLAAIAIIINKVF